MKLKDEILKYRNIWRIADSYNVSALSDSSPCSHSAPWWFLVICNIYSILIPQQL